MIERVDERQRRGTVEGPAVVKGGRDAHRRLVDIWNAEIDFPHDEISDERWMVIGWDAKLCGPSKDRNV